MALGGFGFCKLLVESVDASVSSDVALFASVEGVAIRASFNLDLFENGTSFEGVSARDASHRALVVIGVDVFLHFNTPFALWVFPQRELRAI